MKDSRSLNQSAQEILRIKAVNAIITGKTQDEVSELFGVSLKGVNNWQQFRMNQFEPQPNS